MEDTKKGIKTELTYQIVYNAIVKGENDISYQCAILYDGYYIKSIGLKNSSYNDMIKKCKETLFKYFNWSDDMFHTITTNDVLLSYNFN